MSLSLPIPSELDAVPIEQLPAVLAQLAALQAAVAARLVAADHHHHDGDHHDDVGDHLLGIQDAAQRLAVTPDWLRRRPALPFVVKLSDGVVRYSAVGIARFIAEHHRQE